MKQKYSIVFGLTADPLHLGHEQAIINAVNFMRSQHLAIEQFILLPVFSPHLIANKKAPKAGFSHRFTMCKIAAKRLTTLLQCKITTSKIEKELYLKTNKINYSYDTLTAMQITNPLFMVSADHFQGTEPKFKSWHNWQALLNICGLLINQRPKSQINHNFILTLRTINPHVFIIDNAKQVNISSAKIRKNFSQLDLNKFIASDVLDYIYSNDFYPNPDLEL